MLADVFGEVYRQRMWGAGSEFYSGTGSHNPDQVQPYVTAVNRWLMMRGKPMGVVDLGCGDFNIGKHLYQQCKYYIGCDVVSSLIDWNANRFPEVQFQMCDITQDPLPNGDVAILRQVLQHLSNHHISQVVEKLQQYAYVIVTEHIPHGAFTPNINLESGCGTRLAMNSGVRLTDAPFKLSVKRSQVMCSVPDFIGRLETTVYTM